MEAGKQVDCVMMDFSKAFNKLVSEDRSGSCAVNLAAAESRLSAAETPEPERLAAEEELAAAHRYRTIADSVDRTIADSGDNYCTIADSVERSLAELNEASRTLLEEVRNAVERHRCLETRPKQLSQQQSSKPSASTSTNDRTSSASEPPTANIMPIATPAAAQKHAAAVTSVSSGSSSKAATPNASIRPMAISSQQTPTATVMPTPSSVEFHKEQITGSEQNAGKRPREAASEAIPMKRVRAEVRAEVLSDAGDVHATAEAIVEEPAEEGEGGERSEDDVVQQTGDEVELEGDRQDEREGDIDGQSQAQPGDGGEKRPAQRKRLMWTEPSELAASAASAQPPAIPLLTQPLPVQLGKPRGGMPLGRGTAQSQRVMPSQQQLAQQMGMLQFRMMQQVQQFRQQPVYRLRPML
ncbi:PREDICTED: nucleoprotein TPR-like [Priapulus caudatus]|uniref:Nucleoprotein TPR-like n=1 Tax=Priapulus caudatus TaxID=37621 RepID=A0ABM1EQJ3_PRICU|nr:PREDICTED: nucleoprotein TPR-like [Priapulus caudatus]